jgi:catechol 2,3-dioxygenase-like lactoylglutathione lyase family enzyme
MEKKALVSPIKTVVQVVSNLDRSREIYEKGLGLKCIAESRYTTEDVGSIWGVGEIDFRIARMAHEGEDFGCVDLVENPHAVEKMRDPHRAFDYGIMTLNFRTNDIDAAVERLTTHGAEPVSDILSYNVGKPMRELMMITPTGERLTIIEVGGKNPELPVFNEAIATAGMVVPAMTDAKRFYADGLGLTTSIEFQAAGAPFDALLGVDQLDALDFATLTSDGIWTGKVELLELAVSDKQPVNTSELADLAHTGYAFVTFLADDLDEVGASATTAGGEIIVEPAVCARPFYEGRRAMIMRSPGGEYIELIEEDWR